MPAHRTLGIVLLLVLVLTTACGTNDETALDNDMPVSDVLARASDRLAETQSMRFDLRIEGTTYVDSARTIQLTAARGVMARPDAVDVEFQARLLGATTVTIRMITVDESSWTTNLVTGDWEPAPEEFGYNPSLLYDQQDGLGPVMSRLESATVAGTQTVDGRAAYHVTATASAAIMRPLTSGTMRGDPVRVELWVDGETWDLLRIVLKEPRDAGIEDPATWTMHLTDHDAPVSIKPPA